MRARARADVDDGRQVRGAVKGCDAELHLLLGRHDISKRHAFLQIPEVDDGTSGWLHARVARRGAHSTELKRASA